MKIIGLDVGTKRIGVARADSAVKIAIKHGYIEVDGTEFEQIKRLARTLGTNFFVIGLPRSLQGEETAQSRYTRLFAKKLKNELKDAKIAFQDESLTSVESENRLKNSKKQFEKGDIDAESATIILQDFLENFPKSSQKQEENKEKKEEPMQPEKNKPKHALLIVFAIFLAAGIFGALLMFIYNGSLSPVSQTDCSIPTLAENSECVFQNLVVDDGMNASDIASALKERDLIQNQLTFQIYAKLNNFSDKMQAGKYRLNKTMSVQKIVSILVSGETIDDNYRITALPGGTLDDFKETLFEKGFSNGEIEAAFAKVSNHPVLESKPADASLEGYIFGETIEFSPEDSVEDIVTAFLDEFLYTIEENHLEEKFLEHGLTLHEGIILASIVQKEAHTEDMKNVASVFYNRLNENMTLGSDVTASYAANQVDKNREIYTDNAAVLAIDSCYNTRINTGLPCGPISNPGLDALLAVAEPAETPYFYFLTGDDGMMYYGITESDHQMNIETYCQEFCNIQL